MSLWTASDAAAATGGQVRGDWAATGVSIDTRTLESGDLFVALKDVRDGHDFVAQALEHGAAAAMVSHVPEDVPKGAPLLIVGDVLAALGALGQAGRARTQARVLAITGSVGKTSTKEMARVVLERQGRTHAAEASYNNHWGVPLTLARMPVDTEYAVIEIGMNHPGEIAPLARLSRPHVAMITMVTAAHLEAFDDITGIAREKAAIFEGLEPGGICLFNADLDAASRAVLDDAAAKTGKPVFRFGTGNDCPYRLIQVDLTGEATIVQADLPSGRQLFKISSPGRHFAANALGVLAAVEALGADVTLAARDLSLWQPPAGRGTREVVTLDAVEDAALTLIDDAFNANPSSMAAALEVLVAMVPQDGVGRIASGRRIAVLGDMLELGGDEMQMHADLADLQWLANVDIVHCVGPRMRHLWALLPADQMGEWTETADEMAGQVHRLLGAGDVVLVKGSKGSCVSRVVDAIRKLGHPLPMRKRGTL